jgi:Xaa-Pro aminopeptidase
MKTNIDTYMAQQKVDVLVVLGAAQHNPDMVYFTGIAHMTRAVLLKKQGVEPVLMHQPMERDEATKSGFETRNSAAYNQSKLPTESSTKSRQAVHQFCALLSEFGVTRGRVAVYGFDDIRTSASLLQDVKAVYPDIEILVERDENILELAMATKSADEVERIRNMGLKTAQVVAEVADFLTDCHAGSLGIEDKHGNAVTIERVKRLIDLELIKRGAENPEGTIFSQGRDAGVPHSTGNPSEVLQPGKNIVFDIFPCEMGGGFFYDFTRTWSLGYATEENRQLYQQVLDVYQMVTRELATGKPFYAFQQRTCELFESFGHDTIIHQPMTTSGYVHSLGHGVGLRVHEHPFCVNNPKELDCLQPGCVFTIEPGLYYPDLDTGVRIEDTYWVNEQGKIERLVEYSYDLVIPIKNR